MSQLVKGRFKKKILLTINAIITDGVADPLGGNTSPIPGVYNYHKGDIVTITATPNTGYDFTEWDVNGVIHTENPLKVTM